MTTSDELRATFDARYVDLGLAETALALATGETIRVGTLPIESREPKRPLSWTRPDPKELPRISLAYAPMELGTSAPPPGQADLEVRGVIGEGGMGRVHAARQRSLERDVAVKTLRAAPKTETDMTGLLREAVITGSLEHPGIVPIHALGLDPRGVPVLVMKRIDGVEWRRLIDDPRHPAWDSRSGDRLTTHLEILLQVCQAVHFAHSRGVIHCDIKPENVMLGEFGEVCLVDWGVAMRAEDVEIRQTRRGLLGTPAYMAPELVSGGPVGVHTDVYLLGATLHHVLTGAYRHDGDKLEDALRSAFESEPQTYGDSVPEELARLANRAMSRDPGERHESALEFRQAIVDYLQHKSSIALADGARDRLRTLAALLADAGSGPPDELQRAYQLVSEARFGFTQALDEWRDNPAARDGLRLSVVAAVELELRQGHVESAEALLGELGDPPKELLGRVREARHQKARERAEGKRLRELAHDLDTSVSSRERGRGIAAVGGAMLAISLYAVSQPNPNRLRAGSLLIFALVLFAMMLIVVGIGRKVLLKNAFNRRVVGVMLLSGLTLIGSRTIAWRIGLPSPLVLLQDLVALTVLAAAATVLLSRWLWPTPFVLGAATLGCVLEPRWSVTFFSLGGLIIVPLVALALHRHRQEEERSRVEAIPESARSEE